MPHRPGGCSFAEDPERSGDQARLFWSAHCDRRVIVAAARPCAPQEPAAIDIVQMPHRVTILQVEGEHEEIAIAHASGDIRLCLREGTVTRGPVQLTYVLQEPGLAGRLGALQRWHALVNTGRVPRALHPVQARQSRWPLLIATLDALACGCSRRETAIRLFGAQEVARQWHHPSESLKMRVRRLIAQARTLVCGGYRDLL